MKQQLHIHTFRFLIASLTISVPFALSTSHSPRNYIKKINILHTLYILHDYTTKLHSIHANLLKLYTLLKCLTLKYLTCIYLIIYLFLDRAKLKIFKIVSLSVYKHKRHYKLDFKHTTKFT